METNIRRNAFKRFNKNNKHEERLMIMIDITKTITIEDLDKVKLKVFFCNFELLVEGDLSFI